MKFKIKNNKYQWGDEQFTVEFSKPNVTSFENRKCVCDKDILYYYYTLKLYVGKEVYDSFSEKIGYEEPKKVAKVRTYDFPNIISFKYMLEKILDMDLYLSNEVQTEYAKDNTIYTYNISSENWMFDDYYKIEKNQVDKNKPYYNLYIGCKNNIQGGWNTTGLNFVNLDRTEMIELQKCVNEFIKYSIEKEKGE